MDILEYGEIFKMNNLDQYVSIWVDIKNSVVMLSEISQTKGQILYDPTCISYLRRTGKFIEMGSRTVVTKGWVEWEMGSDYLMGTVSLWDDERILEADSGDGYTTFKCT